MKKQLALVLARDVEISMKILAIAIEEENTYLMLKTLTNAENELAGIRKLLEKKTVERPQTWQKRWRIITTARYNLHGRKTDHHQP